jgi:hypothetical protein
MEPGPRDRPWREHSLDGLPEQGARGDAVRTDLLPGAVLRPDTGGHGSSPREGEGPRGDPFPSDLPGHPQDVLPVAEDGGPAGLGITELPPEDLGAPDPLDIPPPAEVLEPMEPPDDRGAESFRELRPQRRLRIWQLAPIVALGTVGSLMFAFPLAFESGGGGAIVAMLGLLLCCCCAGWAIIAARRVGYTWPGLPACGGGQRPDWRIVAGYAAFGLLVGMLAVLRVARLR